MILTIIQIIIAILLVITTVLQMQGKGFTAAYGGGETFGSKRSLEKFLIWATAILAALFAFIALIQLIYK